MNSAPGAPRQDAIASFAEVLHGQGSTLSIIVATYEPYHPYAELPVEFAAAPSDGAISISPEMTA